MEVISRIWRLYETRVGIELLGQLKNMCSLTNILMKVERSLSTILVSSLLSAVAVG